MHDMGRGGGRGGVGMKGEGGAGRGIGWGGGVQGQIWHTGNTHQSPIHLPDQSPACIRV
jgi:hypothetical protein